MTSRCIAISWKRVIWSPAIGVVLTVGLAWTAMFVPHRGKTYGPPAGTSLGLTKTTDGRRIFRIDEGRDAWHHVVQYWHMQISGLSLMIPIEDYERQQFDPARLPAHLRPESVDDITMLAWYHEVGFPFAALTCGVHWKTQVLNADITYTVTHGLQLPRDKDFTPRAIPLRPVWPGFIADVALWSCLGWIVLWSFSACRRALRSRSGRCRACGYPRTGLPEDSACPECGSGGRDAVQRAM